MLYCSMMKRRCCVDWVGGCCLITRFPSNQSIKSICSMRSAFFFLDILGTIINTDF
ncbi:hypothetical protein BMETH_1784_0 [methanotrophic bacterial endosymbiont of Bathymodiolus sp.]|nr:hypothetical protein BMETH_1784_0 [methanotrophic bacterial endosymbiont of Bathymodiolus sp.]